MNASDSEFVAFYRYQEDESDVMSIILLSVSSEYTDVLQEKSSHEVVQLYEKMFSKYARTGRSIAMREILSNKMQEGQYIGDHLIEMRTLFAHMKSFNYPATEDQLSC